MRKTIKKSMRNCKRGRETTQKHLDYATESKPRISMAKGLRTLNISSLNPDSMRGKEMRREIGKGLTENKIRLSTIQGAHITRDFNYLVGNYRVITSAGDKNNETGIATGGAAIMIHGSLQQNITQITRQSGRYIRVTLDRAKSKMPIHIIPTFAPRNGHTEGAKRKRWGDRCTRTNR